MVDATRQFDFDDEVSARRTTGPSRTFEADNAPPQPAPVLREAPAAAPEAPDRPPRPASRKRRIRAVLFGLGFAVVLVGALTGYLRGGRWAGTDDSYVKAAIVNVATDVPGLVAEVAVHDNQAVKKDDLLFRLDDEPYRIALDGAKAQLGVTANQLRALQASYVQAQSQIVLAQTDLDLAKKTLARQTDLAAKSIASQATFDQAHRDFAAAQSRLQSAQQQAQMTFAQLGGAVAGPIEEIAQYRQALAQVAKAERDLRRTRVTASEDGIATNVPSLQPGNYLNTAQVAFNLVSTSHVWVEAFMKETDLTYVKPGDKARISVDTYPGRVFDATVEGIAPATGSQFSVLPAQNSSGNWVKVVQRIVVRLRVEQPADGPKLRAGMSVVTDIDTGHSRSLATLPGDLKEMVGL